MMHPHTHILLILGNRLEKGRKIREKMGFKKFMEPINNANSLMGRAVEMHLLQLLSSWTAQQLCLLLQDSAESRVQLLSAGFASAQSGARGHRPYFLFRPSRSCFATLYTSLGEAAGVIPGAELMAGAPQNSRLSSSIPPLSASLTFSCTPPFCVSSLCPEQGGFPQQSRSCGQF